MMYSSSLRSICFIFIVATIDLFMVSSFQVIVNNKSNQQQLQTRSTRSTTTITTTCLHMNADTWNAPAIGGGAIETLEFKIYSDGRVEETVRGIKGGTCHTITKEINEKLGAIIASTPTEEMFEQPIVLTDTINLSNGWDSSSSSSSSGGLSSW